MSGKLQKLMLVLAELNKHSLRAPINPPWAAFVDILDKVVGEGDRNEEAGLEIVEAEGETLIIFKGNK